MKKLRLTELAKDEIKKDQLNELKGGNMMKICIFSCDCSLSPHMRGADRRIERKN